MSTLETTSSTSQSPTPDSTTTRSRRYPLTWLRALAALSVLTFHAYQHQRAPGSSAWPLSGVADDLLHGTELFVDLFFVLSAFVLFAPIARSALAGEPGRSGRTLLFKRAARLLPLYVTVVAIVWALTNPSLPGHWQDLVTHLTFTQIYSDDYIFWTDGPAWSLAVEFHFYLLLALCTPLIARLAGRARTRVGRVAATLAVPAALAGAGALFLGGHLAAGTPAEDYSVWFGALAKAPDFAIGMTLAVLATAGVRLGAVARQLAGVGSVVTLVALALLRPGDGEVLSHLWSPLYALAIAVGLASIVLRDGEFPAWMSFRPLVWLGGLGYGIYLLHEPVLRLVDHLGLGPDPAPGWSFLLLAAAVAVLSTALAWVSSRTVEAAGLKLLSLQGGRDYYAHLDDRSHSHADRGAAGG